MAAVKSPELRTGWKMLMPWLAGASTLFYLCSRLVPAAPPIHHGEIEDSYIQFLHTAFAEHLQFGRDILITFGPWGFLYGGYSPVTHTVSVIAWLGLSLVFWWTGWRTARHLSKNDLVAWFWLMAFAAVAGLPVFTLIDARLKAFVVLLWLLYFFVEDRPFTAAQAALVAALGLLSLVKFNVLVETAMVLGVVSLDTVFRRRRFPWLLLLFGASLVFFWVIAGQHLGALGPFLRGSWQLTGGYTEAMMLTGPEETSDVACFLLASALVCAIAGYAGRVRHRFFGLFPLVGLGFILFAAFKHGYVRHDFHEAAATLELLLVSLAALAIAWPVAASQSRRAALASLLPTFVVFLFAAFTFGRYYAKSLPAHLLETLSARSVLAPAKLLLGRRYLREGYQAYLADIRKANPLPAIQGEVDTYPGNAGVLLAHRLAYRPRPVMQSYQVYTPELADLNAAFLRSERAPAAIVFQIAPVDDHFPSLEDDRSWPELLTRYDVQQVEWPFVLLKRSVAPRAWRLAPLADLPIRLGELVPVPPATNGPIWATFEIDKTLLGTITSTVYKPPVLSLSVFTPAGGPFRYRLIPGMARSGFLLSPVTLDPLAFGSLAAGGALRDLADQVVTSLSLSAATGSGSTACYHLPLRLRLYRLEYPGQDLSNLEGFRELKSLSRMIGRAIVLRADRPPQPIYLSRCGSVLQVAPDSAIQFSLEGQPKHLRLGFGILEPGAAALRETNGISFQVSAVDRQGELVPLWSRRLDPLNRESSQGRQRVLIDLNRCPSSELVLETMPDGPKRSNPLQCYWSEIELE